MSDNSIVQNGNLVGDGGSVFEHSALDHSLFYPPDMSALPTSTPNPANLRRKSRRSWFETTPKGFKFEIAVEKPVMKPPARKSDTVEVLTLTHFSAAPRLGFGTLKIGQEKTCTLLLRNPHDYKQSVKVEKFPEKKHFSIPCKEFTVGPEESYPLDITWSPKEAGGCREMVMMQVDSAYRVQAYVFGTVSAPPPQKKKGKRVGLLASKTATRPLSIIQTKSLANINQQYSPEKKTGKQFTKPAVEQRLSKQVAAKSVKPWAQPKDQVLKSKAQTRGDNLPKRDRRSGEPMRKSPRLSDKVFKKNRPTSRSSVDNIENTDPDNMTRKERRSSGRKGSLPKPNMNEKVPRKKMRRSNTYSQVSGLGLVVPIIHGDAVKGLKDTSLINIDDCDISGVEVLGDTVRKNENDSLIEPSFIEPNNKLSTQRSLKEATANILEPSFIIDQTNDVESKITKEETKTLLKSKEAADPLEPSFLEECKATYVTKSSAFRAVKSNETFHDSLELENKSLEEPSFLQNEIVKPDKPRRSLRKRSGIIEVENKDNATGVKLLRGAKRNNARKIISPEEFASESCPKDDDKCEKATDKHKPLDESVGQSSLLEQLKSLKSFVHDKSVEIDKSANESLIDVKESAVDMQRRETFVKRRTSPRFSMPAADVNIRRGTFVTEPDKLKLLETQKPSEASPRRTTFTVLKESSNSRKLLQGKPKNEAFALNEEEEELDNEIEEVLKNEPKHSERLYSADSLENDSFEKQKNSPDKIFVEEKVVFTRRATLTVTKSRPSDALLEHAKRSSAVMKKLADESAAKHLEQTIPEDLVDTANLTEVREEVSQQRSSQNSTFEVPLESSILVAKDSSFPTTPYHLLPTSPLLNHSRRSTHVVEKPKVVNLSKIDGKQLFTGQDDENEGADNETEKSEQNKANVNIDNENDTDVQQDNQNDEEEIPENKPQVIMQNKGPSSNLRRRKLSARRSVTSLGRKSVESLNASLTFSDADNVKNTRDGTKTDNSDIVEDELPDYQQTETVEQLFFVPFGIKEKVEQQNKPRTKRPDPKQFLKKRSNPVTQDEDRIASTKRSKSESAVTATTRDKGVDNESRNKGKPAGKSKEAVVAPARVTRQRVKSVGVAKTTNPRQAMKPTGMVKGLATSKLILTKKSKTAIPKHPLPFAAKNMFYDERWMEKQERGFVNWLNFILTPPEEHQGSDVKVKVDAGKLTLDIEKGRTRLAPTNEILSFRTYSAHRKLNRLRKSACRLFQSESVRRVIQKVEEEVENKRLLVRKDKMLHADVGAKQKVLDMLLSYNPLWLRVGLETIYGEVVPIQCNTDVYGLSQFIVLRVLGSPDIAEEFAHPTVPHLYRDGYAEATAQHTLKRFLMLVYFLDQAKQNTLIDHNPCLFCKNSDIKASKDMLYLFSRDFLSGEGDITRHLGYLGYKVTYSQTALDEFDFAVKSLGTDLRDGLRLARVMEVICENTEQIRKSLRTPAISRLQKIHNMEVVFKVLEQQKIDSGVVSTRDLVDGHREKTLSILWTIILHYQVAMVINVEQIKEEIQILERSLRLKKQLHKLVSFQPDCSSKRRESEGPDLHTQDERLNLLMKWCRAVCAFYDIKIENFTVSFSDGRALCHILHYYHPKLLPLSVIHNRTSMTHMEDMEKKCQQNLNCSLNDSINSSAVFGDTVEPAVYEQLLANEKENFKKLSEKVKELGGIPLMIRWSDMSNTIPDEKVVVTYLMYLCARLLDIRHESRAARVIQHAWRAHRLKKMQALYEVKGKAIIVIQRAVRQFLQRRREKHRQSAALCIQRVWRGHCGRTQVRNMRLDIMLQKHMHAVNIVQNAVRRYLHRRRYLMMKSAVVHCRGFLYRRTRQTAATNIQRVYRGHLARQRVKQMHDAAVKIQACVRSILVRERLHKQVAAVSTIQCRYRDYLSMRKEQCAYRNLRNACITIQKCWRRNLAVNNERQIKAAVTIQACFRCWSEKKRYNKLQEKTVYIQAALRGCIQRRRFDKYRSATVLIQRRFRNYLLTRKQRKLFLETKRAVILMQSRRRMLVQRKKYLLLSGSATKLQAYTRMLIERQKFQRMKSSAVTLQKFYRAHLLMVACRRDYLITVGATITLQAGVRGMICRRQYEKTKRKVILTQAAIRGHLQYKKFQNLKWAAVVVQKRYRETMVAKQQRSDFLQKKQAVTLLQSAWRMRRERRNYLNLKSSVIIIQSAVRKMMQQNKYKKMKFAVQSMEKYYLAKVKGRSCRRQFLVRKGAVMTLQAAFRGHRVRKAIRQKQISAVKIQSAFRGYVQRCQYLKLKVSTSLIQRRLRETLVAGQLRSDFVQKKQAAISLQSTWRMTRARNSYLKIKGAVILIQSIIRKNIQQNKYKKIKSAVKTIEMYYQAKVKGETCRRQFLVSKGAAMTLQAAFRGHKVRKNIREKQISSVKIQSAFRGYLQRRQYLNLEASATLIQRRFRETLVAKQLRSDFVQKKQAAICFQSTWRMRRVRNRYIKLKGAVIFIQSVVRRNIQQNKYKKMISAVKTIEMYYQAKVKGETCRRQFLVSKGAAMTLQAAFRGHKVRKAIREKQISAVKIQSTFRGYVQRQQYLNLKASATLIQRRFRETLVAKQLRSDFVQKKQAAIRLQSIWRMTRARNSYIKLKGAVIFIQSIARKNIQQNKYKKMKSAVKTIEKHYCSKVKGDTCRRQFLVSKGAAMTLQAAFRGYKVRKAIRQMQISAVKIQSAFRRYVQRRQYLKLKASALLIQRSRRETLVARQLRSDFFQKKQAAICLQSTWRMTRARNSYIKLKGAVIFIQSVVRKNIQQNKYKKMKSAVKTIEKHYCAKVKGETCRRQFLVSKGAAMTLQAAFRGHKVRKAIRQKKQVSALKIQSAFRGYFQRRQYLKLKASATNIQRRLRETLVARQLRSDFVQKKQAAIYLQSTWRMTRERNSYIKLKGAVIFIQSIIRKNVQQNKYKKMKSAVKTIEKYYQAKVKGETCRRQFLVRKGAVMTLQAAFRGHMVRKTIKARNESAVKIQATYRGFTKRKQFQELRKATLICQRNYKLICLTRKLQSQYLEAKNAAKTIQAAFKGFSQRKQYRKICCSIVKVQSVVRAYLQRQRYKNTYSAVVVIQKRIKETLLSRQQRSDFLRLKRAAIFMQSVVRMKQERDRFASSKAAAILIQSRVRGYMQQKKYMRMMSAANIIKKYYRARTEASVCRRQFLITKGAAITIQAYWRGHQVQMRKKRELKLAKIVLIQRWIRCKLQRLHYLKMRQSVRHVQSRVRSWLTRRDRAARVIQRAARLWLADDVTRKQSRAAIRIQALWRGYHKRKTIKSRRLTLLRQRVKETAATATEEKKLCNRTSSALDFLLRYKLLSQVMEALQHLDVASRLSWICCERMVEAIPVLYRLVESCNRSLPHMDIIKCTISILTNLAKYEKTRGAVYEAEGAVDILVNLMQIYREKPPVFNKICTLFGILALDTPCKTSIMEDKKLVEKLTSIQSLTARKHKLEENQRVTRARMNASSLNATFLVSAPVKKHKIEPEWALHKDKMNDIENPLKAINFVLGNLGIKPKSR